MIILKRICGSSLLHIASVSCFIYTYFRLEPLCSQSSTEIMAWINKYNHGFPRDIFTHPFPNSNDGLAKPPLKFWRGSVITLPSLMRMHLLIPDLTSISLKLISFNKEVPGNNEILSATQIAWFDVLGPFVENIAECVMDRCWNYIKLRMTCYGVEVPPRPTGRHNGCRCEVPISAMSRACVTGSNRFIVM